MAEALTQSQIDELLSRMRSGDSQAQVEQEDKVKEYDFSSPKYSLNMDNARTMEGKHKISDDPFLKK